MKTFIHEYSGNITAWKVSQYEVISAPYLDTFHAVYRSWLIFSFILLEHLKLFAIYFVHSIFVYPGFLCTRLWNHRDIWKTKLLYWIWLRHNDEYLFPYKTNLYWFFHEFLRFEFITKVINFYLVSLHKKWNFH